jgi:hypothetical protein
MSDANHVLIRKGACNETLRGLLELREREGATHILFSGRDDVSLADLRADMTSDEFMHWWNTYVKPTA